MKIKLPLSKILLLLCLILLLGTSAYCKNKTAIDINTPDANGWTPLGSAIKKGDTNLARLLIEQGADVNRESIDYYRDNPIVKRTPLMLACYKGNADLVSFLIQHGARVNEKSDDTVENTPIIYATMATETEDILKILKTLITSGANINVANKWGYTPLMHALIATENIYCDPYEDFTNKRTSIQTETVKILLDSGANVNATRDIGSTALMAAVENASQDNHLDLIKTLLDKGADVNATTNIGETALLEASLKKNPKIAKLLIDRGANVNAKTKDGNTALLTAAFYENLEIVKLLIDRGADVNVTSKTYFGYTPLMNAVVTGNLDMVQFLLEHGVEINAKTSSGSTALILAKKRNRIDIVEELIRHGAI